MIKHLAAINAQAEPGAAGGIATFMGALITALGKLDDSDESYLLVGSQANADWLESIRGSNQEIVIEKQLPENRRSLLRQILSPFLSPLKRFIPSGSTARTDTPPVVSRSQGFWEELDCEVVHFPYQHHVLCEKPTIYNPHDLQHLHYPEYFSERQMAYREAFYPSGCRHASCIVTASQWIKNDIIQQFGTKPEKIQVIPWAPPTQFYAEYSELSLVALRKKLGLSKRFILYPAVTWPHKNHMKLIEALATLKVNGLKIPLVCTGGSQGDYRRQLDQRIAELGLGDQVFFLGFLPRDHLRAVYRMCTTLVVPTLFEAASGPIFEAWQEGKPVACSTVTSLPEQVGDSALLFDPTSVSDIADAIRAVWSDEILRKKLANKGRIRLQDFSWNRTARAYRAVYRRAAGHQLSKEDNMLLSWDWMRNPSESSYDD